jgi:glycosyltransferase involved in cell wall biosynthesis
MTENTNATTLGGRLLEISPEALARRPVVLIPAYKPARTLPLIVGELVPYVPAVLVVDDGSGPEYRDVFAALAAMKNVHVMRHVVNLGKGAALKTGLNRAACDFPECVGVVTADADGQHAVKDILRIVDALVAGPHAVVLGARRLEGKVPFRSRVGNVVTRQVLRALTGQKIYDTQTGLRGIPMSFISTLVRLGPNGYDFELEMLLACRRSLLPVAEIPIDTIYLDGNRSSHFNPLLDSMRIYFLLIRFATVSLSTAVLDNLVFLAVFYFLGYILASQVAGRLVAGLYNYRMNQMNVFHSRASHSRALPKYWGTVAVFGAFSYGLINVLHSLGVPVLAAKVCAETVLFLFGFVIQRDFVFAADAPAERP